VSQTAYNIDLSASVPGMLADNGPKDIIHGIAAEDIPTGRFVRLVNGKVELPKDDTGALAGVAIYVNTLENANPVGSAPVIKAGAQVAILRKGRIWAGYNNAGAPTALGNVQMKNDVATAASQGMVTGSAASAGVTRTLGGKVKMDHTGQKTTTMILVEVNYPD
jgi:hypothetical protein